MTTTQRIARMTYLIEMLLLGPAATTDDGLAAQCRLVERTEYKGATSRRLAAELAEISKDWV